MSSIAVTERRVPQKGSAPPGNRGERRLLVEFSRRSILDELNDLAAYKDIPVTVMVRGWIMDRLREEQRRIGWEPPVGDHSPGGEQ